MPANGEEELADEVVSQKPSDSASEGRTRGPVNATLSPRIMGIVRERADAEGLPMHILIEMLEDA